MATFAYLDLCFFERCNLTCTYCRTTNEGMLGDVPLDVFRRAVQSFLKHSKAAVFKVSGYGEVSLWKHLAQGVSEFASEFPTVQVMTNGTMPWKTFHALLEVPNLVFCVTLDGDQKGANEHRTAGKRSLHDRMFSFAQRVVENGRGLELNCVLTAANIDAFPAYLEYVRDEIGHGAMVMPFPVRPFVGLERSAPSAELEQIERTAESVLSRFDEYAAVLPSKPYLERLFEFMRRRTRAWSCFVPAMNYGVGPRWSPLACACLGHTKPSDDLFNQVVPVEQQSATDRLINVSALRSGRVEKGYVDERCGTCFTHYEVLNLYLEGSLEWPDIERVPSFSLPGARQALEAARSEIDLPSHTVRRVPAWKAKRHMVTL